MSSEDISTELSSSLCSSPSTEMIHADDDNETKTDTVALCFLCQDPASLPDPDCKSCHNLRAYHSKKDDGNQDEYADKVVLDIAFPGPGIVMRNHIYGNYVVASRTIETGELIILEKPISIGPYSPPDILPLCVTCCKDIGRSLKCSKCKWPVCGSACEKFPLHAENECQIFLQNQVKPPVVLKEYFSVETIRLLLLKERNVDAWERVLAFESHSHQRENDFLAKASTEYIQDFIHNKCNLTRFSAEEIDHVVGVLSINTFWAFKELNRYASCLFDKITLFAHDCDPNTTRELIFLDDEMEETEKASYEPSHISSIALRVKAGRRIEEGEMITIRYVDVTLPLLERRRELRDIFYFDCTCSKCLCELTDNQNEIETKLAETVLC
ncbi:Histone-lysine N-methyltransferase Smyd1 [Orchesella cincta]|uniref:Histone-lysine N-methyltransferase Smyd1 n=1 Tax=Orchesella cincta TaxID=48709 RepID=A0A1D2NCG5_ORCCI|nr:Histone-lysine N-methyltransferase Smyd1 [Orchesella cincta]